MALATYTIANSIEWAKKFTFARGMVLGNSLEPALTSAYLITQTILSPPFEWWWNNEELVFTCNPTPNSATSTVISIVSGVLTVWVTRYALVSAGSRLFPSTIPRANANFFAHSIELAIVYVANTIS